MKKLIENFIIIMVLTIAILFSYALIEKKISGRSSSEFINFLFSTQEKASSNKSSVTSNKGNSKKGNNSSTAVGRYYEYSCCLAQLFRI